MSATRGPGFEVPRWRRVDPRSIPAKAIPWCVNTYIGYLLFGSFFPPWVWAEVDKSHVLRGALAVGAWGVTRAVIRRATSFYLVDTTRLRFATGLIVRRRITVERALVRYVGLRRNAIAQLLGATEVDVNAAQHHQDVAVRIRSLPASDASALRDELFHEGGSAGEAETLMADGRRGRCSPRSRRPRSACGPAPTSSSTTSSSPGSRGCAPDTGWLVTNGITWEQAVRALLIGPVIVGLFGAVLLYLESWWGYRLTRHRAGTLRVAAGLVVRREVTFLEERVVGVEYVQPLMTRFAHRVRVFAVSTGASSQRTIRLDLPGARRRTLMPLGPPHEGGARYAPCCAATSTWATCTPTPRRPATSGCGGVPAPPWR